jgi:hypothetical protein
MAQVMRDLTAVTGSALSRQELRNWNSLAVAGSGMLRMVDGTTHAAQQRRDRPRRTPHER